MFDSLQNKKDFKKSKQIVDGFRDKKNFLHLYLEETRVKFEYVWTLLQKRNEKTEIKNNTRSFVLLLNDQNVNFFYINNSNKNCIYLQTTARPAFVCVFFSFFGSLLLYFKIRCVVLLSPYPRQNERE